MRQGVVSGTHLRRDVTVEERLLHGCLAMAVIGGSCKVTPVVPTAFVVPIGGSEKRMHRSVLFEMTLFPTDAIHHLTVFSPDVFKHPVGRSVAAIVGHNVVFKEANVVEVRVTEPHDLAHATGRGRH